MRNLRNETLVQLASNTMRLAAIAFAALVAASVATPRDAIMKEMLKNRLRRSALYHNETAVVGAEEEL